MYPFVLKLTIPQQGVKVYSSSEHSKDEDQFRPAISNSQVTAFGPWLWGFQLKILRVAEVCSQGRRKVPWQQMMLPCFIDGQAWTKLLLLHLLDTPLASISFARRTICHLWCWKYWRCGNMSWFRSRSDDGRLSSATEDQRTVGLKGVGTLLKRHQILI